MFIFFLLVLVSERHVLHVRHVGKRLVDDEFAPGGLFRLKDVPPGVLADVEESEKTEAGELDELHADTHCQKQVNEEEQRKERVSQRGSRGFFERKKQDLKGRKSMTPMISGKRGIE